MNAQSKPLTVVAPSLDRRAFLKSSALAVAASALGGFGVRAAEPRSCRVGLIGTGWYGKSDLFRLIQVAPVEVVSLCDPDKQMLAGAAELVSQRQKSKKTPRTYTDYRAMLKEKNLDIVLIGSPDRVRVILPVAGGKGSDGGGTTQAERDSTP